MKIVHISTFSSFGGASIATYRIHKKMLDLGIDSHMLVLHGQARPLPGVTEIKKDFFYRLRDYIYYRLDNRLFRQLLKPGALPFSFNFFKRIPVEKHPLVMEADIISLYWIGANFMTPEQVGKIRQPIVWRLSDKWVFTGGCHYSGDCGRYQEECGNCHQLKSNSKNDFTHKIWKRKNDSWKDMDITVVAPSKWIEKAARSSSLLRGRTILRIPTGVDENVFKPLDKKEARDHFGIPRNVTTILFGAVNPFSTGYKGGNFFNELVKKFPGDEYLFLIFGMGEKSKSIQKNIRFLGIINDEVILAKAYNASDIFISPSIEDNLPNTVLEAMACGTPCVAFKDSGGVEDVIIHKMSGYLAAMGDTNDMAAGIEWILNNNKEGEISQAARNEILREFTLDKQVERILDLYRSILLK